MRLSSLALLRLASPFVAALGALVACSSADDLGASSEESSRPSNGNRNGAPTMSGGSAGGAASGDGLPAERELESSFVSPVATGNYVWIANPTSGRVAYIDASSLAIRLVNAGDAPTYLTAIPDLAGADVALVLNVRSADATLLRATGSAVTTKQLPVPSSGNGWAVSANGRWALAWTDSRRVDKADPVDGYQAITVLGLTAGAETSTALTVGYRPVSVSFRADGSRAYVVTQDGVTVIDLLGAAPTVVQNLALAAPGPSEVTTRDVVISPDGAYALVRPEGAAAITVVALADGKRSEISLPGVATDLDLAADGKTAVVALRAEGQVALLPLPGVLTAVGDVPLVTLAAGVGAGSASLASTGNRGFFYTNATASPFLTVLNVDQPRGVPRTFRLRAPVQAVLPTPDAAFAVVLHDRVVDPAANAPKGDASGSAGASGGASTYPASLSLVPVANDLPPKIVGLRAAPVAVAIAPDGAHALIATGGPKDPSFALQVATFPSLNVREYPLASAPIAAGIVAAAGRGFVSQRHPDGRITFVDFRTGDARTLTGFELAARVVDGGPTP